MEHPLASLLLITRDESFVQRMSDALEPGERIALARQTGDAVALATRIAPDLVAIDGRRMTRTEMLDSLAALRSALLDGTRIVVVARLDSMASFEVITRIDAQDLDVLMQDRDPVEHLLRAQLNDASTTVCAATALAVTESVTLANAGDVASEVLASGCAITTVKQIARRRGVSTDTVEARLADEGSPPPKLIIRMARCCYAAALSRRGATWNNVCRWTRYGKLRALKVHMRETLGPDLSVWRRIADGERFEALLAEHAATWLAEQSPAKRHAKPTGKGHAATKPPESQGRQAGRQAGRQVSLPATFKEAA